MCYSYVWAISRTPSTASSPLIHSSYGRWPFFYLHLCGEVSIATSFSTYDHMNVLQCGVCAVAVDQIISRLQRITAVTSAVELAQATAASPCSMQGLYSVFHAVIWGEVFPFFLFDPAFGRFHAWHDRLRFPAGSSHFSKVNVQLNRRAFWIVVLHRSFWGKISFDRIRVACRNDKNPELSMKLTRS